MNNQNPTSQQLTYPLDFISRNVFELAVKDYMDVVYDKQVQYLYSSSVKLTVNAGSSHAIGTLTGDITITADTPGKAGQHMWVILTNDASLARVATFSTNISANGTLTGTVSKLAIVEFISNGTKWYEVSRTTGLTA